MNVGSKAQRAGSIDEEVGSIRLTAEERLRMMTRNGGSGTWGNSGRRREVGLQGKRIASAPNPRTS